MLLTTPIEDIITREDIPQRTDLGNIPAYNSRANKQQLYGEQAGNWNGYGVPFQIQHLEMDHIIAESVIHLFVRKNQRPTFFSQIPYGKHLKHAKLR